MTNVLTYLSTNQSSFIIIIIIVIIIMIIGMPAPGTRAAQIHPAGGGGAARAGKSSCTLNIRLSLYV